jgi:hypothetical protein
MGTVRLELLELTLQDCNGRNHCCQPCTILYYFTPSEWGAVQWPVKHAALLVDPSTFLSQVIAKIGCAAKGGVYKEPLLIIPDFHQDNPLALQWIPQSHHPIS